MLVSYPDFFFDRAFGTLCTVDMHTNDSIKKLASNTGVNVAAITVNENCGALFLKTKNISNYPAIDLYHSILNSFHANSSVYFTVLSEFLCQCIMMCLVKIVKFFSVTHLLYGF